MSALSLLLNLLWLLFGGLWMAIGWVIAAVLMAITIVGLPWTWACGDYTALLAAHDIAPSMSRIGNPYDNAKAESFMKTPKQEEVDGRSYRDAHQTREMIGSFIEEVYNRQRLHSALAYQPPVA